MSKAKTAPDPSARKTRSVPARQAKKKHTKITPAQREESAEGKINKHWRTYFLQKLAETSNVTASAAYATVAPSRAYKARREDAQFAAAWRAALFEGYEHLEMEVLGFLRGTEPDRKFDVANAIRLLAAHSATIAKERALSDDNTDEQAVLDSIDAMIDQMRERSLANAALLAETDPADDPDHG
jgi:hypothetical protein